MKVNAVLDLEEGALMRFHCQTNTEKRREYGLETWVLFLDLVKAFDRAPRELLFRA